MSEVKFSPMYVGTMNDGLFIIDQPPRPAPKDYDTGITHRVNVIATMANNDREASSLARLIAAAPDLLEALVALVAAGKIEGPPPKSVDERKASLETYKANYEVALRNARAAIAKAEGKL